MGHPPLGRRVRLCRLATAQSDLGDNAAALGTVDVGLKRDPSELNPRGGFPRPGRLHPLAASRGRPPTPPLLSLREGSFSGIVGRAVGLSTRPVLWPLLPLLCHLSRRAENGDLVRLKRALRAKKAAAATQGSAGSGRRGAGGGAAAGGGGGAGGAAGRIDQQTIQEVGSTVMVVMALVMYRES